MNSTPNPFVGAMGFSTPGEARALADEARSGHPVLLSWPASFEIGADPLPSPADVFPGEDEAHGLNCVRLCAWKTWVGGDFLRSLREIERSIDSYLDAILIDADEWPHVGSFTDLKAACGAQHRMLILRVSASMALAGATPAGVAARLARYAPSLHHVTVELDANAADTIVAIRDHPQLAHIGIGVSATAKQVLSSRHALHNLARRFGPLSVDIVDPPGAFSLARAKQVLKIVYRLTGKRPPLQKVRRSVQIPLAVA